VVRVVPPKHRGNNSTIKKRLRVAVTGDAPQRRTAKPTVRLQAPCYATPRFSRLLISPVFLRQVLRQMIQIWEKAPGSIA
jgi:hypothetical protein